MKKFLYSLIICLCAMFSLFVFQTSFSYVNKSASAAYVDDVILEAFNDNENLNKLTNSQTTLSSSFNVLDYIDLELYDQNPYGTCFAMSLAQTVNLSYEYRTKEHIKVSALALALQIEDLFFDSGSNNYRIFSETFDLKYISEYDFPYELASVYYRDLQAESNVVEIDYLNKEIVDVAEYYNFPNDSTIYSMTEETKAIYLKAIKQALASQGALSVGVNYTVDESNGFYVYDKSVKTRGQHAMTLVGYDDNFDANNFISSHKTNGAFIILNSWGTEEQIVYMSYEDFLCFDYIFGIADFIDVDERDEEISNIDNSLYGIISRYSVDDSASNSTFGYQMTKTGENDYLSQIDLQPVFETSYTNFYNSSIDIKLYLNRESNNLDGATTYLGEYDISAGVNKIVLSTPIEVADDFAIKVVVLDNRLPFGFFDENSQNFNTLFYTDGSWQKVYLADNFNYIKTPFLIRSVLSEQTDYQISKEEENFQYLNDIKQINYQLSSSTEINNIDVKIYKYQTVDVFYDSYNILNADVSAGFNISFGLNNLSISPKTASFGTFKVVISLNNGEKQFIKFLRYDDGINLITMFIDPDYALRLYDNSFAAEEINIEVPSMNELACLNNDGTEIDFNNSFLCASEDIYASSNYIYDAFSRITKAEITFTNSTLNTTRTLVINFDYQAKCKIVYVTNLPDATHSNPEYVANGQLTYLEDASHPNYDFVGWFTDTTYTDQREKFTPIVDGAIIHFYAKFEQKEARPFIQNVSYDKQTQMLSILLDFSAYDLSIYDAIKFSSILHEFKTSTTVSNFSALLNGSTYIYRVYVLEDDLADINSVKFDVTLYRFAYKDKTSKYLNTTIKQSVEAYYAKEQTIVNISVQGQGKVLKDDNSLEELLGSVEVDYNSNLYLKFVPNSGYYVADILLNGVSVGNGDYYELLNITSNTLLTIVFETYDYTITTTIIGNGSINNKLVEYLNSGDDINYIFTSKEGHYIDSIYVDGEKVETLRMYYFENLSQNHTIQVTFKAYTYTISTEIVGSGDTSENEIVIVEYGDDITYRFYPDDGYEIAEVWIDGIQIGVVSSYKFEDVKSNHTIKIVFEKMIIKLTFNIIGSGSIDVVDMSNNNVIKTLTESTEFVVEYGTSLKYVFKPSEGYYLSSIYVNGTFYNFLELTHENINRSYVFNTNFKIIQYRIKVSITGKGIINHNKVVYKDYGSSITYTFTPDEGYRIDKICVNGENLGAISTYQIENIAKEYDIEVYFAVKTYAITWRDRDETLIAVTTAEHGSYPEYSFSSSYVADDGETYVCVGWNSKLDGSGTDVLMATQNATYYAKYVIDSTKYTITATAGSNGMISPSGAIKIKEGESQKFTIIANDGYHIANIFVDGQLIEVSNEYEFKNVSCNHSISVQFKKNDFKATINSDDKFGIVSGAEWFENGERAVFKIVTKDGIKIKAVKVNGKNVSVSNNSFVIESVSSNLDIVVEYEYENSLKNIDLKYVIIGAVVIVVLTSVIIVLIKKKRKAKVDA